MVGRNAFCEQLAIPDKSTGITGGFAPPTPNAIFTVKRSENKSALHVTSAIRPSGTPSLQDGESKELTLNSDNEALIEELYSILRSIPTESPPGSEDIYGLDTSIAFGSGDFMWMNGGPQGCGHGESSVKASEDDKAKFKRAIEIVKMLVERE
ncbi:hypothetical protein K474DRAFT_1066023 [Panus rudis PR-1116 ss-1]|nr:hypothetical protein K474DRAFT_1066023 [Panus rudis PR-1116 ss-1]